MFTLETLTEALPPLAIQKLEYGELEVPTEFEELYIKEWTGVEQDIWDDFLMNVKEQSRFAADKENVFSTYAIVVALSLCDEDGNLICQNPVLDYAKIKAWPKKLMLMIFEQTNELNVILKKDSVGNDTLSTELMNGSGSISQLDGESPSGT